MNYPAEDINCIILENVLKYNRPTLELKLFINVDGTKFKDHIFTHIRRAKNQFPRKSNI